MNEFRRWDSSFSRGDLIGVGVRESSLLVVRVRQGVTVDCAEIDFEEKYPTEDDFRRAHERVCAIGSRAGGGRTRSLHVAVGPARCQLRLIKGIPLLKDNRAMKAMLQENVTSFFLKTGVPLRLGDRFVLAQDGVWATAFDSPVIEHAIGAAKSFGIRDVTVIPSLAAVTPPDPRDATVVWHDGMIEVRGVYERGTLRSVERIMRHVSHKAEQSDFADALGAISRRNSPLRVATPNRRRQALVRARGILAVVSVLLATASLVAGPIVLDMLRADRNERYFVQFAPRLRNASAAQDILARQGTTLSALNTFADRSVRPLETLAVMSRALPDSVSIVSFHMDSLSASITLIGRDVVRAVEKLRAESAFRSVEISGPLTREMSGLVELERVAIRVIPSMTAGAGVGAAPKLARSVIATGRRPQQ